ncbi:DUF397 domain-containing protein [Streptomyces sp. NPDC049627]|uniref:DUF397 domain-containing protein n=1 Tax=Streptomyces sp. NPDC049627 TaxID=3365595 RepID=UPI0037A55650
MLLSPARTICVNGWHGDRSRLRYPPLCHVANRRVEFSGAAFLRAAFGYLLACFPRFGLLHFGGPALALSPIGRCATSPPAHVVRTASRRTAGARAAPQAPRPPRRRSDGALLFPCRRLALLAPRQPVRFRPHPVAQHAGVCASALGRRTGRAASQRLHYRGASLRGSLAGCRSDRGNLPRRFSEKGREVLRTDGIWVKSSHSESGACVEVSLRERLSVRDSKDPRLAGFSFDVTVWSAFISAVHAPDAFPRK